MGRKGTDDAANRDLRGRVEQRIQADSLFGKEDIILVALSGGADSVALLCILFDLGYDVYAYHLNHGLRGEEADSDERFCRQLCKRVGIPLYAERIDVRRRAEDEGISFEDAGRKTRYEGLALLSRSLTAELDRDEAESESECEASEGDDDAFTGGRKLSEGRRSGGHPAGGGRAVNANGRPKVVVATGHHAGDVAETFVMNAMRGAGLTGLCSIAQSAARRVRIVPGVHPKLESLLCMERDAEASACPKGRKPASSGEASPEEGGATAEEREAEIRIVRPLLHVEKSELESYLVSRGTKWQTDSTNESEEYFRNRVRKCLDEAAVRKILDCIELLKTDRDFLDLHTADAIFMHVYERRSGVFERIGAEGEAEELLFGHAPALEEQARLSEYASPFGCGSHAEHAAEYAFASDECATGRELLIKDCESLHPAIFSRLIRWVYADLVGDLVNLTGRDVAAVMGLHRVGSELSIGSGERKVQIYRSYQGLEFSRTGAERAAAKQPDREKRGKCPNSRQNRISGAKRNGRRDDMTKKSGEATKEVEAWEPLEDLREEPTLSVRMRRISGPEFAGVQMTDSQVAIDMGKVRGTLRIRSREEGDAFIPFGMKGRKTLKKLLIDEKIDRRLRSQLPIVVDDEKIVWVAGVRMSEEVRVSRGRTKVIGLLQLFDPRSS